MLFLLLVDLIWVIFLYYSFKFNLLLVLCNQALTLVDGYNLLCLCYMVVMYFSLINDNHLVIEQ